MWSFEQKVMGKQSSKSWMISFVVKPMVEPMKLGILHDETPHGLGLSSGRRSLEGGDVEENNCVSLRKI
jgi:hypothetical protein